MNIESGMKKLSSYDELLCKRLDEMRRAIECGEYSSARMIMREFDNLAIKANTLANKLSDAD